jgi:single-strand DNA-binding protein
MIEFNKVFLAGRLTQDPELRYTPSGIPVTSLRLAVNTTLFPRDAEKREEVLYINATVWRKRAETCVEYLRRGSPVFLEGRLQSRNWETQDGQKRTSIEVLADRVQFLEWADDRQAAPSDSGDSSSQQGASGRDEPDDIPF